MQTHTLKIICFAVTLDLNLTGHLRVVVKSRLSDGGKIQSFLEYGLARAKPARAKVVVVVRYHLSCMLAPSLKGVGMTSPER